MESQRDLKRNKRKLRENFNLLRFSNRLLSYAADDEFERRVLDSITEEDLRNFNPNADLDLARQRAEIGDFFMEAFRHYGSR